MKTILLLTDFSKNAGHAGESAVWLAEKLHAGLCLWHCEPKISLLPSYPASAGIMEDRLAELAVELRDLTTSGGADYQPQLQTRYREGDLRTELKSELASADFEMIAMGAATDCATAHLFTGSDTYHVIETANCPVLVVPPRAGLDQLDKVVFATDFETTDLNAISYLAARSMSLGFRIEIVHITVNGEKDRAMIDKESEFTDRVAELQNPAISFKEIRGKEVVNRLNRVAKQTGADLLAMTHHQYNGIKMLFNDSVAKKELSHQRTPLLVFPSRYHEKNMPLVSLV